MEKNYFLELEHVEKYFGDFLAVEDGNLKVALGEVVAIIGQNGAGKSTMMNMILGSKPKSNGIMKVNGKKVHINSVAYGQKLGIAMVHQELQNIKHISVAENIFLNNYPIVQGKVSWNKMFYDAKKILLELGIDNIDVKSSMSTLSIAQQQMIEIAKSVSRNAKLIILDEPTSPLSTKETKVLFELIKKLKKDGKGFIYITHRIVEIKEICDRAYVMKNGKYYSDYVINKEFDSSQLINDMVGEKLDDQFNYFVSPIKSDEVLCELKNIVTNDVSHPVNYKLKKGEIVGVFGLVGSKRSEFFQAISGLRPIYDGDVIIHGKKVNVKNSTLALKNGISYISEDRKANGGFLKFDIKTNLTISSLDQLVNKFGVFSLNKEKFLAKKQYIDMTVVANNGLDTILGSLSGGNQQKVVLGKSIATNSKLLIFDEPTRGVDIGSRKDIYKKIIELRDKGTAIFVISSELPELLGLSDRIWVFSNGKTTKTVERRDFSENTMLQLAFSEY